MNCLCRKASSAVSVRKGVVSSLCAERCRQQFMCGKVSSVVSVRKGIVNSLCAERYHQQFLCGKISSVVSVRKGVVSSFCAERYHQQYLCGKVSSAVEHVTATGFVSSYLLYQLFCAQCRICTNIRGRPYVSSSL